VRFYPFGSGSLDISSIPTASVSSYASATQSTVRVVSASRGKYGIDGLVGINGSCSLQPGPQGDVGAEGPAGPDGTISTPQ
jgi:hypothetical protein